VTGEKQPHAYSPEVTRVEINIPPYRFKIYASFEVKLSQREMMPNLLPTQLIELENNRAISNLDVGPGSIYPYYDGYSLVNLPASICQWLNVPLLGALPLKQELTGGLGGSFRHVILVVIDGIGLDRFLEIVQPSGERDANPAWQRLLSNGTLAALTSIVPSTTSAALTSLWTGRTAVEHGIIGYEVWLKEYAMVANMITHSAAAYSGDSGGLRRAGFQPEAFLPVKTLGVHLGEYDIETLAFMPNAIARSGLSNMQMGGVNIFPYHTLGELWVSLGEQMGVRARSARAGSYTYVYWGDIDSLSHRFGPGDERVRVDFESFSRLIDYSVEGLQRDGRGDTLLVITADHGHITTYSNPAFEMRHHPELLSHLVILPTGENRLPYLFLKPGREDAVRSYIEKTWPGKFRVFESRQVIDAGLLGQAAVYPPVYERAGDLMVFPQENAYWWFANRDNPLIGRHGGLSRDEMLVPFYTAVI
jgi:hypothetical protein